MIYRIDPGTDRRWQPFLETQRDASIFHTAAWLEALRRTYGYEPVVYTTTAPGRDLINGIPFCQVSSHLTGQRLVSLPFSDHCQPLADDPEEFDTLIAAVKWDARKYHSRYIEMKPIIPFDTRVMASSGLAKSHDAFIHRLDLRRRSDEVLRGFHKHCIGRKIARSEREQLRYEEGRSEDLLRKFYRLLLLTRRRHRVPPQPLFWFQNLMDCLGPKVKIRVASTRDGTPIASIITLSFKNVVTYKYSCSDSQFNALGGTILLIWKTIEEAMREGARELDLGRSDFHTPGLITFKDHWGAARNAMAYYTYPAAASQSYRGALMLAARGLVSAIPDRLFSALGGLLYRHAG